VALVGGNLLIALLALPRVPLPPASAALSTALAGGGTLAEIPHPVLAGPLVQSVARSAPAGDERPLSAASAILFYLAGLVGSLRRDASISGSHGRCSWCSPHSRCRSLRMNYEEQVLSRAFPEYETYATRSWRLIPGVF